jgi:hypothetical protein
LYLTGTLNKRYSSYGAVSIYMKKIMMGEKKRFLFLEGKAYERCIRVLSESAKLRLQCIYHFTCVFFYATMKTLKTCSCYTVFIRHKKEKMCMSFFVNVLYISHREVRKYPHFHSCYKHVKILKISHFSVWCLAYSLKMETNILYKQLILLYKIVLISDVYM